MRHLMKLKTVLLLTLLFSMTVDIASSWVLTHLKLGNAGRIAVALAPVPGKFAVIALILVAIRRLDDFQKRIHFEAVTVAFLSTGVGVFIFGYLQEAHVVGQLNMGLVWTFMIFFYATGYFIAKRHYQ